MTSIIYCTGGLPLGTTLTAQEAERAVLAALESGDAFMHVPNQTEGQHAIRPEHVCAIVEK